MGSSKSRRHNKLGVVGTEALGLLRLASPNSHRQPLQLILISFLDERTFEFYGKAPVAAQSLTISLRIGICSGQKSHSTGNYTPPNFTFSSSPSSTIHRGLAHQSTSVYFYSVHSSIRHKRRKSLSEKCAKIQQKSYILCLY